MVLTESCGKLLVARSEDPKTPLHFSRGVVEQKISTTLRYRFAILQFHEVPKKNVPEDIKVGTLLHGKDSSGQVVRPIVKEIKNNTVLLDFNHPLAGKTLFFDVKVVDVH